VSDITHKIIADLRAELEYQRTRAEFAKQELAKIRLTLGRHPDGVDWTASSLDVIAELRNAANALIAAAREALAK